MMAGVKWLAAFCCHTASCVSLLSKRIDFTVVKF